MESVERERSLPTMLTGVDPVARVEELGGVARADQLATSCDRRAVAGAVAVGRLRRLGRGWYAVPSAADAHVAGARLNGTIAGPSAALEHGWEVLRPPDRPWVMVPRTRDVTPHRRRGVHLVWGDATGTVTPPLRTVLDCARRLPVAEALAVADSALRSGAVDGDELRLAAGGARGPGSAAVRRVAEAADPRAAGPLESALRAIALDVPGLRLVPQLPVAVDGRTIHPDLVDDRLRLVVEAEGWLFHGDPRQFHRDLRRYTSLVVDGWVVVRFGWAHVVDDPDWVRDCLESLARTAGAAARRSGSGGGNRRRVA